MNTRDSRAAPGGRSVRSLARRVAAFLQRRPMTADAIVAMMFAVGGVISLTAQFELDRLVIPNFHEPAQAWPILAVLAATLPLALRRRFPLAAATAVIGAFVVGRALLPYSQQEQYLTVLACWLAL
jgi:hypothetical protein